MLRQQRPGLWSNHTNPSIPTRKLGAILATFYPGNTNQTCSKEQSQLSLLRSNPNTLVTFKSLHQLNNTGQVDSTNHFSMAKLLNSTKNNHDEAHTSKIKEKGVDKKYTKRILEIRKLLTPESNPGTNLSGLFMKPQRRRPRCELLCR